MCFEYSCLKHACKGKDSLKINNTRDRERGGHFIIYFIIQLHITSFCGKNLLPDAVHKLSVIGSEGSIEMVLFFKSLLGFRVEWQNKPWALTLP